MSLFSLSHVNCGGPQGSTDDGERFIAQIDTMEVPEIRQKALTG